MAEATGHVAVANWAPERNSLSAARDVQDLAAGQTTGHTIYLVPGANFVQSTRDFHAQRYIAAGREALGLSTGEDT